MKETGEHMAKYFFQRLISMLFVLLAAIVLVFTLMEFASGDPVRSMLGENATEEQQIALRENLGLDRPYLERLAHFAEGDTLGKLGVFFLGQACFDYSVAVNLLSWVDFFKRRKPQKGGLGVATPTRFP